MPTRIVKCPTCNRRRYGNYGQWSAHMRSCKKFAEAYGLDPKCPTCGKGMAEFKNKLSFTIHAAWCKRTAGKRKKPVAKVFECRVCHRQFDTSGALGGHMNSHKKTKFTCSECGKKFGSSAALRGHQWIHNTPEAGKEWGDKDEVRMGLQKIASTYLQRIPLENRLAICLPGDRPDNEMELLSNPGFAKIYMAEIDEAKAKMSQDAGFEVQNEDFLTLASRLIDEGKKLAMIDYDVCGTVSYAEGSSLISLVRRRGITDIACIRITTCRRHPRRNIAEAGIEAFGRDLEASLPKDFYVASRASSIYVGKDRASMMVEQWILRKAG